MKILFVLFLFLSTTCAAMAQSNFGELRLHVVDPAGLGVKTHVTIESQANQYHATLSTNAQGDLDVQRLPFGTYQVQITHRGFEQSTQIVNIRSSVPVEDTIRLELPAVNQSITVNAGNTLINPDQAGAVNQIGHNAIQHRLSSLPGRSLQDLINSQPGWLYEGNAVLHPRGSEYQTQFVIDGVPFTNNLSPGFGTEVEADDVQSMTIYTAGIPAEYGRKLGGVVVVNTLQNAQPGFHGQVVLSGGSFDTADSSAQGQYTWGANSLGFSAGGGMTGHYLNPVVPQNYSNTGTIGDFSANFQRDLTPKDRVNFVVRHQLARFDIPNEYVQQAAGQRQTGDDFDTMGIASYEHTFSSNAIASVHGMVLQNSNDINSNAQSTPIEVFQHNWFREGYLKADATIDHGHQEWKFGVESDNKFLNERFRYAIADPTQFPADQPPTFAFLGNRPELDQGAYVQDLVRLKNWTINAGLRWDHYQLLANKQSVSPRLAVSRFFPSVNLVLHASYDRVFNTPASQNMLLSSSTQVESIAPNNFLRLPVEPSQGDYYEAGIEKVFNNKLKIDTNYFRRTFTNYADDDQIQDTTISFPIAFSRAIIYGVDSKIELPQWGGFSGYVSYSYEVGNVWLPVTGGLFLNDSATAAVTQLSGHFPDSQDQRNTVNGRLRYQLSKRVWLAGGLEFGSGLPFQFDGNPATALAQYGTAVFNRLNFTRGRIVPTTLLDASAGAQLYKSDLIEMDLEADGENLNNVVDVIDFNGLFSDNAIGPSRSFSLRLTTTF
ncbi:MAG TPA: TonB-dependent receptor [Candidatus Dormibacteraeota bacterium]|nr:TonB-dependent receptor [Candidatus Dormibacteraeota bacterium]